MIPLWENGKLCISKPDKDPNWVGSFGLARYMWRYVATLPTWIPITMHWWNLVMAPPHLSTLNNAINGSLLPSLLSSPLWSGLRPRGHYSVCQSLPSYLRVEGSTMYFSFPQEIAWVLLIVMCLILGQYNLCILNYWYLYHFRNLIPYWY